MTTYDETLIELLPWTEREAKRIARSYPPVDWQDIKQDLSVFLLENRSRLERFAANIGMLREALRARAVTYCRRERSALSVIHDTYVYRPDDVREALPHWYDYSDWQAYAEAGGPADGRNIHGARIAPHDRPTFAESDEFTGRTGQVIWHNDKAEGLAVLVDISRVYERLSASHKEIFEAVHMDGAELPNDGAERKRYDRGIDALTELMNGVR